MKTLVYLLVLIISFAVVRAQELIVKFNLQDGSAKTYKISDIENFDFIHSNLSYQMIIFDKDNISKTEYDIRDIDSIRIENNTKIIIAVNSEIIEQNISDIDSIIFVGNTYEVIQICNQVWLAKNLDVSTYRNGDAITQVTDTNSGEWEELKTGAWCYYHYDPENGAIYGKLYNWYAVNDPRGLAPEGWHVPSDEEWKELEMCLGMSKSEASKTGNRGTDQGSQLAGRADLWKDGGLENNANFGTSGFSALPGGHFHSIVSFFGIGSGANWWSSSEYDAHDAWYRSLYFNYPYVFRSSQNKKFNGYSVRCVKD